MKWGLRVLLALTLLLALGSAAFRLNRPPRTDLEHELFAGVSYTRRAQDIPRPLIIHVIKVDLTASGIGFLVTPPDSDSSLDTWARTAGGFLEEYGLQVAINGAFFDPFRAGTPWSYEPMGGDPVDVRGLAISNGQVYSQDYLEYPVLCLLSWQAQIRQDGCPPGTRQALAGNVIFVQDGQSLFENSRKHGASYHPRTAVGLDKQRTTMWMLVVDGRQPAYSEGVSMGELAEIMVQLGAEVALNLDGGGSTTLVMEKDDRAQKLNSPIHTRIPTRQRPVGNHLGIYAVPIDD